MYITIYLTGGCIRVGPRRYFPLTYLKHTREHSTLSLFHRFDEFQARAFLNKHFGNSEIYRLRTALAGEVYNLTQMSDADVVSEVAHRLSDGTWIVTDCQPESVTTVRAERTGGQQASTKPALTKLVRTTRALPLQPATPWTVRREPIPESLNHVPQLDADWSDSTEDQVAQAEALENASRQAIPFCEVCEAARKAKAEGVA